MAVYTLPASGTISFSDMRTDGSLQIPNATAPISLGAMRRKVQTDTGSNIPWNTLYEGTSQRGNNANIPTSGEVSLSDFHGAIGWLYSRFSDIYYYRGDNETVGGGGKDDPPIYNNDRYISIYWADIEVYTSSTGSGTLPVAFTTGGYTYERYSNSVTSNYYLITRY